MNNCIPNIYYSIGGMAQYYESPLDILSANYDSSINKIVINTSVQPNSIPHFGTITTFMGAFLFAVNAAKRFQKETYVEIDFVDCGPTAAYHQHGGEICLSIAKAPINDMTDVCIADYYISKYYVPLLGWLQKNTGIEYRTRRYKQFQAETAVRKATIEICNNQQIKTLLSPHDHKLHIRAECPVCGNIDKLMKQTSIVPLSDDCFIIESHCILHGSYSVEIRKDNNGYFEANTQIRDIAKGALMDDYYKMRNLMGVMFDGGDWGGTWTHFVHCMSLQKLNYQIPIRLFSPLILDWSGGKLSKSIYRNNPNDITNALENYETFLNTYGEQGLFIILNEVAEWVSLSKKFFRNYSLDYILALFT